MHCRFGQIHIEKYLVPLYTDVKLTIYTVSLVCSSLFPGEEGGWWCDIPVRSQSLFCCCTASMEQVADRPETAAIDGLVSSWSENISVSFCLRAPRYGLTLWCALGLLARGRNTSASVTVTVTVPTLYSVSVWVTLFVSLLLSLSSHLSVVSSPSSSSSSSPLSLCITLSQFHSRPKTYLFHKSFPP